MHKDLNDRDRFAVWISVAILNGNGEEFAADAIADIGSRAEGSGDLDREMDAARSAEKRPGDLGIEFTDGAISLFLLEFGRLLWDAYAKALAEKAADAVAKVTIDAVKALARRTWSGQPETLTIDQAEARLREAVRTSGLNDDQANQLVARLRAPKVVNEIAHE